MEKTFLLTYGELKIPCKLYEPDCGEIRRIVLGVHGLCGSLDDEIQAAIAEEMELFYSATVRFDFPAHGSSPMDSGAFTLKNCVNTLLAVAGNAMERYPQVRELCVFATGFGAYVTLIALQRLQQLSCQLRLVLQTPSVLMHQTLLEMRGLSRETLRAMDRVTFQARRPLEVTYSFYKELEENIALTGYSIPMLILHGEQDDFIRREHIQHFHRLNEASKLVIIPGASHRFLEEGAWDMVLDLTRDWFEFEQVLVTDWE